MLAFLTICSVPSSAETAAPTSQPLNAIPSGQSAPVTDPAGQPKQSPPATEGTVTKSDYIAFQLLGSVQGRVYYPTGSKITARFGDSWDSTALAFRIPTNTRAVQKNSQDQTDVTFEVIRNSNANGHVHIVPLSLIYNHRLSQSKRFSTYIGAGASASFVNIKSKIDNVDTGTRCLPGMNIFAGFRFSKDAYWQATYMAQPSTSGFDVSGLSLSTGFEF